MGLAVLAAAATVWPAGASANPPNPLVPKLVRDIAPFGSSAPAQFLGIGDTLFFAASDGVHGRELWRSDGTEAGTRMVKDINPSGDSSFWRTAYDADGILLFFVDDGVHGGELWRSDGTEAGTTQVKEINPVGSSVSATSSSFGFSMDLGASGTLLFNADDGVHGTELWRSDGSEAGTEMVKDIDPFGTSAPPGFLYAGGIPLYFYASDGVHGIELWRSDGTEVGTKLLMDVEPGSKSGGPSPLQDVNGTLYFPSRFTFTSECDFKFEEDCPLSFELYMTNGTEAGTGSVGQFESHPTQGVPPTQLTLAGLGDKHLFATAAKFWVIDPVLQRANLIADGLEVHRLLSLGSAAVASAEEPSGGEELWISDGTSVGTKLLKDIYPGPNGSVPQQFIRAGSTVFFTADDGVHARELWALDINQSPVAFDDQVTLAEDAVATPIDVLANDTDSDGGPKRITALTQPAHGTVAIIRGGSELTYQPDSDYCGVDSFSYELNGGSTGGVSVTVTCMSHPAAAGGAGIAQGGGAIGNEGNLAFCLAKARRMFHRQRMAARQTNGKVTRASALRRIRVRRHKAISTCRARHRQR